MKTNKNKRRSPGAKKYGKPNWNLHVPAPHIAARRAAEAAMPEMDCQYIAVVLKHDREPTRTTYKTADEAVRHAQSKIGEVARTQGGKALQFAICKVVEIVEPTTPTVARRAPKRGDGTPSGFIHGMCPATPIYSDKCYADDLRRAFGKK